MAIAILVPIEPTINQIPLLKGGIMPFSWSIFSNSLIIFLIIPISLLIFNIFKKNIQFPYVFLGYKMNIKKAKEKFVWPLEKIVDGKRKFIYMPKNFDAKEELNEFEKNNINEIWVTPKIPFMVPLLIGFIFAFIFGDILFYLISLF
jgi:preflagellin peptidase FlaK